MDNLPKLYSNWLLVEVLHGLFDCSVFDVLNKENESIDINSLAKKTKTKPLELETSLDYICLHLPELLQGKEGKYLLSSDYNTAVFQNLLNFSKAYSSVVHEVSALTSGTKLYGEDVSRDDSALAVSSESFMQGVAQDFLNFLMKDDLQLVIDLGCGSGHLIEDISKLKGVKAMGIDIHLSQKQLSLTGPVGYCLGDVRYPKQWFEALPEGKPTFIASMVLHEFLYKGSQRLGEVLLEYKTLFPASAMYVLEYNGFTNEQLKTLPDGWKESASLYQFVHPFTQQGVPLSARQWHSIFSDLGIEVQADIKLANNVTVYKLILS